MKSISSKTKVYSVIGHPISQSFSPKIHNYLFKKYNIDAGRIFMQGMSMGNMMTSLFARNFGNVLAGAAGSGCASFLSLLFDENEKIKKSKK